jgi:hypothetical protein
MKNILKAFGFVFAAVSLTAFADTKVGSTGPGFEIRNKSNNSIWFTLQNGPDTIFAFQEIPKEGTLSFFDRLKKFIWEKSKGISAINKQEQTELWIWTADPNLSEENHGKYKYYYFPKNKTVYVTYDQAGLRPQTGILKGIGKYTDSGYSLSENVIQDDTIERKQAPMAGTNEAKRTPAEAIGADGH